MIGETLSRGRGVVAVAASALVAGVFGCGSDEVTVRGPVEPPGEAEPGGEQTAPERRYVLGSVTIDADGNRVSYAQLIDELSGHITNREGIEAPGNATFLSRGSDFFYGLAESPEWVRYSVRDGALVETGRLSFLNFGVTYMDFANTIVDDETAVSVLTQVYVAVVWNPRTMEIKGTIELPHLRREGLELETFTTVSHDGLVYVPGKWVNWTAPTVLQRVSMTILDPATLSIVGVAEDERCGAGGRVTFDRDGYAYVMGDGRNQSMQVFAAATGQPVVSNCLLRIPPGQTSFDPGYFYEIPSLTGGLDSMSELEAADMGAGVGFTHMYYEDRLPAGLDLVNFEHWTEPVFKMWRIDLGDPPVAREVSGASFSVLGFSGSSLDGKLYSPESVDGVESTVFEIDPESNTAVQKFTMDGYFSGLHPVVAQ